MRRLYCPSENIRDNKAVLLGQSAVHVARVLRMKQGDNLLLFNGGGKEFGGVIQTLSHKKVVLDLYEVRDIPQHSPPKIILCSALIKGLRFDWVIEKGTELGADVIIPVITARTELLGKKAEQLEDKETNKIKRWNRIAVSAAEQCGRLTIPEVRKPETFSVMLKQVMQKDKAVILWEGEKTVLLRDLLSDMPPERIFCFTGPEGGFTLLEVEEARQCGVKTASLGSLTLRADTAPIAALAILRHVYPW